jgi:type VI secretion system protein ImpK
MSDTDDLFKPPSDATVLRPRPGAGRRGASETTSISRPPAAAPPPARIDPIAAADAEFLGKGLSPLVQAASSLLLLAGQLRGTLSPPDVPTLRRHAMDEIRRFEERARASGIASDVVMPARYALCAAVDEAVLSTPWGSQSEWRQQSLLVALHREAWGGEKFFDMLDRIEEDPARHVELLELQYLCMALGFAGKYHVQDRGHVRLDEIRQEAFRKVREQRGVPRPELSIHWRGLEDRRNPIIRYIPWWVVGAAALAVLSIAFTVYYMRLGSAAAPVQADLAKIGSIDLTPSSAAVEVSGPTLKALLAPEERAGAVAVEEQAPGTSRVTIIAPDLFASGSATINPRYRPTIERIASAIQQVPGRVMVEGHTDDQPIQSLRYRDNFELSRERAVTVATILQVGSDNPGRIKWRGVGPSEPRYGPETGPDYRARNRRVEIIHVRGS